MIWNILSFLPIIISFLGSKNSSNWFFCFCNSRSLLTNEVINEIDITNENKNNTNTNVNSNENVINSNDNIVNSKIRFTSIAYPSEYTLSTLTALTEARINVDNEVLDGLGIIAKTDTYVNNNSFLDALNLKTLDVICNNKINTATHKGGAIFENNLTIASVIAGIRELRLTVGANISRIMSNGESLGGSYNGAIPYFNTIAYELPIIDAGNNYLEAERNELKNSGGSCPQNNSANSYIDINKQFTTYKLDNAGNVDKTYQSVNTLDTMSIVREYFFRNIKKVSNGLIYSYFLIRSE